MTMTRRVPRAPDHGDDVPWRPGMAYPCDTHRGIATVVPIDQSETLDDWCRRYRLTKRDVLAAMVEWFLEHEGDLEQLLEAERKRPILI